MRHVMPGVPDMASVRPDPVTEPTIHGRMLHVQQTDSHGAGGCGNRWGRLRGGWWVEGRDGELGESFAILLHLLFAHSTAPFARS
ncbi:uncharacterized protein FIBRA_05382 [Fibroporia radiculosa]|uniref:Uncharacterized protein n=1 Tax=Fibroporia radiculosa TaxID=599839 RepID=J4IAP2_9APHY|nr:uncharacterized protein FIBRA_05382 [Fibroporia radiculosa]CCM03256.1 predicted protein [Fibroporia radiculosa]